MLRISTFICAIIILLACVSAPATAEEKPLTVFVLAGDEYVLENAQVKGSTDGRHEDFYPNAKPTEGERRKHVTASVYAGAYSPEADYDRLGPVATADVEIGYQRTKQKTPGRRGRVDVPMTPFPEAAMKPGHTTVLRGFVSTKVQAEYGFHPGEGDAAYNVTTCEGTEVYRREPGMEKAVVTPMELTPGKRYAFRTVFFKTPGHAFGLPRLNKPGTLETMVATEPKYAFLRDAEGNWVAPEEVLLYDSHPVTNNTKAPAAPVSMVKEGMSGPERQAACGVVASLSHRLAEAVDGPVLIIRHGVRHPIWFRRGSRTLSHDYRSPSSGGAADHDGSWDVIHFNHGIHDTGYRDPNNYKKKDEEKFPICIPLDEYEKNLRTIVARLKKTGATLIWARTTPVMDETHGWKAADIIRYNEVADKVMKENGVILNDLYAESIRQGFPKRPDVHSVGKFAPMVTKAIEDAIASRKNNTQPLPRVLMIGDSITGTYWPEVQRLLDGKAYVCKNPANAGTSRFGAESIEEWVDLNSYLLNGQEYLQLTSGVRDALKNLKHFCPQYADREARLGGVFWFQGHADRDSLAKAEGYEAHLANLIRDLRTAFNTPKLPVVVAAMGTAGKSMGEAARKVFDAQMAVSDPEKYPEFAGTVLSIDTRKMARPGNKSPGGRDIYKGNAATYLEIGDAMAEAMVKLRTARE